MQNKDIYIISNLSEQQYIKNRKSSIIYEKLDNYLINKEKEKKNIFYLYDKFLNKNKNYKNIKFSWEIKKFLNETDNVRLIPIQSILTRKILIEFLYDYRAYICIKKFFKKNRKIIISSNCTHSLLRMAKLFPTYIEVIKFKKITSYLSPSPIRANSYFLKIYKLSNLHRFFHSFFIYFYQNKNLYFKDWSSYNEAKKLSNVLILNGKPFFKTILINNKLNIINQEYNFNFRKHLSSFKKIFIKFNKYYDHNVEKIFENVILTSFNNYKKKIDFAYCQIEDLFKFYKPKSVILNGETDWLNILISHICRKKKIKVNLLIDGYQFYTDDFLYFKFNKKYIFDKYFCFGDANLKLINKAGIDKKLLENINHPLLSKKKYINLNFKKIYDFTILFYQPNIFNYMIPWDFSFLTHYKLVSMLNNLGVNNVCIKIKPGNKDLSSIDQKTILKLKQLYQSENQKDLKINIAISNKELNYHCHKTGNFIGQISTSIIECYSNNVPYYIYEPHYNGNDKKLFQTINLLEKKYINYNIIDLSKNIINKNYLKINKKKLFNKKKLNDYF
jgi:hypothetical protein